MSSIVELMRSSRFLTLGDLHSNSHEFARAFEDARADGIIVHLNENPSHGSRFGGLEIEEESLKQCISSVKIPVGIAIGDARPLVEEEWEMCVGLGFSFVVMLAHHMPTFVWHDARVPKFVAIGPGYILEQVKAISDFSNIEAIIAMLTPERGYGLPLNLFDVATLKLISSLSEKPVLYSTQRKLRPEDVFILAKEKCKGLLLSQVSYGSTIEECRDNATRFKSASLQV
ncbi:MAG: hypothetical protein ACYCQJ_11485 [Nitrososphaerales archaeon]